SRIRFSSSTFMLSDIVRRSPSGWCRSPSKLYTAGSAEGIAFRMHGDEGHEPGATLRLISLAIRIGSQAAPPYIRISNGPTRAGRVADPRRRDGAAVRDHPAAGARWDERGVPGA